MTPAPPHPRLDRPQRETPTAREEAAPAQAPDQAAAPYAARPEALVTLTRARRIGLFH